MSPLDRARRAWDAAWHAPADPRHAALLRVLVGLLVGLSFLVQWRYVDLWWSDAGLVSRQASVAIGEAGEASLFVWLPEGDGWIWACYAAVLVQSALMTVGWKPQLQALCLFGWVVAFQNRNQALVDGEDTVFRWVLFLLAFAPTGHRWSVDAWQRARAGRPPPAPTSGGAIRMIAVQAAFTFAMAGLEKWPGPQWSNGTAMWYVFGLDDLYPRLALPSAVTSALGVSRGMSWGTLVAEAVIPIAVWFPRTRRPALIAAIAFHLALEALMNLFFFQWIMIAAWLAHLRWDEDVAWIRARLGRP